MDSQGLADWLAKIIEGLVNHPERIAINKSHDEMGVLYTVDVHPDDCGLIIGKEGHIANALRTVLRSAGRKVDVRASMRIQGMRDYEPAIK